MIRAHWFPLLLLSAIAQGQNASEWIEVRAGGLPIILTVPHGGALKPGSFKDRLMGRTMQDTNTLPLSEKIAAELKRRCGAAPHMVICRLHRSKLDCNREVKEAAQGDPLAVAAWQRYHAAADALRATVSREHGAGLLLDIHGHRHETGLVELGYLVTGAALDAEDAALENATGLIAKTSIRELDQRSADSFTGLLRGAESLGALLEARGQPSIPSPRHPSPKGGAYFSGSYDIQAHGSRDGGTISAIQIECPWESVRATPEKQQLFAAALAAALEQFFQVHFQMRLRKN